jgi:hypothetical protein
MATKISGNTGIDKVAPGAISADDFQAALYSSSISTNGYTYLPNGLILQWATGVASTLNGEGTVVLNFPIPFPNACFIVMPGTAAATAGADTWYQVVSYTTSAVTLLRNQSAVNANSATPLIFAIGN